MSPIRSKVKRMKSKIKRFVKKNPARIAAFVSSLTAIIVGVLFPDLPVDDTIVFVLAALGLGEFAQRTENKKTVVAASGEDPMAD